MSASLRKLRRRKASLCARRRHQVGHHNASQWGVFGLREGDVYDQLALRGMTGNMPLASRILRQHNATWRKSADVTIARLEFDSPVNHSTSKRCGGLCQPVSPTPVGT